MRPTTMYGVCKVTGELMSDYYHSRFGVDTRSVRFPGLISNVTLPGGGTTDYAVEIYYEAIRSGRFTCPVPSDVYMDMMYMPDALRACVELMEADPSKLVHRNSFNIASMSFTPEVICAEIRKRLPDFTMDYDVDPVKKAIAELAQLAGRHLRPRGVGLETRVGSFAHDGRHAGAHPAEARAGVGVRRGSRTERLRGPEMHPAVGRRSVVRAQASGRCEVRLRGERKGRSMGKQDGGRVLRSVVVADAATSWDGVCLPAYPAGAPRLSVVRFTVEPRARLPLHRHPVINAGMVLQGELTVVAAGGRADVPCGRGDRGGGGPRPLRREPRQRTARTRDVLCRGRGAAFVRGVSRPGCPIGSILGVV